jgi:hypothetical protein
LTSFDAKTGKKAFKAPRPETTRQQAFAGYIVANET